MKTAIRTDWLGKMKFSAGIGVHHLLTDAPVAHGGDDSAPNPKSLMMASLAGCTGVDVVTILNKMRVPFDTFAIEVEAELTDSEPALFSKMHLIYCFTGHNLPLEKLTRAVELSQEKYCGVSMMYRKIMEITWEIRVD